MHLDAQLRVELGQKSIAGIKKQNEDCIGARIPDQPQLTVKGIVAVIADGVSAAEAGKEASETCVRNFISDYYASPDVWAVKTAGQKILTALNRWLYGQSHSQAMRRGYVSTLSALILKSQQAHIFHVGDTRIYRLRDDELQCLTRDHSTVINSETIYLARAMGMDNRLEMDYRQLDVELGDIFLLTTDGVHEYLTPKQMKQIIIDNRGDYEQGCSALIDAALANKSPDNLSCQIMEVTGLPDANNEDIYRKLSELPFPPPLNVGQTLDGYEVLKEIHASARSQLYLVRDNATGEKRVMKTPSPNFVDDPAYIERFILEQWIGKRVESPYVVRVIDSPRTRSCLYTLMEYVPGVTLSQWIKENPRPNIHEVISLVDMVARGLRAFHRKDVLHQDIKPDNIMLDKNGVVKIIDFGACYAAGIEEISTPFERENALGTADYSAPETRFSAKKTTQSDLFSLAVVCYEMLTGKLPFGDKLAQLANERDLHTLKYEHAYAHNPLVPAWMDGALHKALAAVPSHRYPAMSEFIYDLQTPNKKFSEKEFKPLLERNPLRFWQALSTVQFIALLVMFYWYNRS
ncbi:MAG: bifunctional protein-serine/threonine kinase/phosphatase [Oceanospirillaceae bacterium]|nr:bifunctional protein-serine/threonine kinase/phosphatase [Oceanospirillaceae bacterium]MCP5334494.1 bifunctional protein-serine/threonine kinase/phosphatase [Oceanospirillaceae bacterium]MCP5350801.1 bifunctional protein-serine/threonine kinase/phosphatase [Oceanospirillaceae bacterium]